MRKKIVISLILLLIVLVSIVYAADVKWTALAELTTVADADVLCVVDDVAGTATSKKITVVNLFDTIDTFAELNTIVADKTLVNEEDTITWDAVITFSDALTLSDAATIDQSANNYITLAENSDTFQLYFGGTDLDLIWSDGVLNLRNAEDTDAIVEIEGKDAGEKGILRVLSDGDDKYIELYHDDTDGHIVTNTGDIHIEANGGDINFADDNLITTGTIDLNPAHTATVAIIDITPSAVISTNEADWIGVTIIGAALDPSGNDVLICGANINLSGVVPSGTGGDIDGIKLQMANGEKHAIHIEEGKVVIDNTAGSAAGAEYTVVDIRLNTSSLNANSDIHAIDVAVEAGTPAGDVVALGTHSNVAPIRQGIGAFSTPNQAEYAGEKHTGGTVWADGVDASEIFIVDDDAIYVGSAAVFNEIEVDMATAATKSVTPTFHYNTAADTWTEFFPADDTDGFQQDGTIRWTLADISGTWTNNGDPGGADSSTGYWIKIVRTANADPGTPTPTTVKTGVITTFFWDKTGAMDVLSLEADTITEGGVAVHNNDQMDASSELLAIFDDETGTGVIVFGTAPTFTTSITITGADANPAAAGEIRYDNTITGIMSGGGLRWYDDDSVRLLVDLETDPTDDDYVVAYDSTADGFYMKADADTGGATAYDDIGDPDNSGLTTITFDNAELSLFTGDNDAAASFFTIQNSDADHTGGNLYLLDLDYSADDGDVDADFIKCQDSGGVVFTIQENGNTAITGTLNVTGQSTLAGNIQIDDDSGDSPTLALWDEDGKYLVFQKFDVGSAGIINNEGAIFISPSNDVDDYLSISTASHIVTITTVASGDGDLVITAGGGDISFGDENLSTSGTAATGVLTVTGVINTSVGLDAVGAVDMDYGSADVTDHTFTTDDMTLIMDGGITVSTGDFIKIGTTQWNSADEIDGTKIKDADYGDVDVSAGGAWTLDTDSVADNEIDYTNVTGADLTLTDAGAITSTGTITATVGFDIVGAADIDYGSADVTDHTFLSDGTGTGEFVLKAGAIDGTEILDDTIDSPDYAATSIDDEHINWGVGANQVGLGDIPGGTAGASDFDFGNADLELPQASAAAPDADGEIEVDFTDGTVVIQHGSAHAELGAATDVVVGKLINSFAATIFAPDGVNDVIPLKMIDDLEFPHGIVIVECLLQVGTDSNYTLTLQNYDDFDTINGANGTIDAVAYTAGNNGEVTDTSITYGTIAAGQIIMMSIPSTDVDWIHIEVFYYEPIA